MIVIIIILHVPCARLKIIRERHSVYYITTEYRMLFMIYVRVHNIWRMVYKFWLWHVQDATIYIGIISAPGEMCPSKKYPDEKEKATAAAKTSQGDGNKTNVILIFKSPSDYLRPGDFY